MSTRYAWDGLSALGWCGSNPRASPQAVMERAVGPQGLKAPELLAGFMAGLKSCPTVRRLDRQVQRQKQSPSPGRQRALLEGSAMSDDGSNRGSMRGLACWQQLSQGDERHVELSLLPPPLAVPRRTIVKTSTSYFACASPARTAATLSRIWFQPSN